MQEVPCKHGSPLLTLDCSNKLNTRIISKPGSKQNYPGNRPQTVWGSGKIMYDNVDDDDDYYYYYDFDIDIAEDEVEDKKMEDNDVEEEKDDDAEEDT
jgi:hypothetical protein